MTPSLPEVLAAVEAMDAAKAEADAARTIADSEITGRTESEFERSQDEAGDKYSAFCTARKAAHAACVAYCRTLKPGSVVVPVELAEGDRSADYIRGWNDRAYRMQEEVADAMLAAAQPPAAVGGEAESAAPLPNGYRVQEFIPGIWGWDSQDDRGEWSSDGSQYGSEEGAVVAAWIDHTDTLEQIIAELEAKESAP